MANKKVSMRPLELFGTFILMMSIGISIVGFVLLWLNIFTIVSLSWLTIFGMWIFIPIIMLFISYICFKGTGDEDV